MMKRNALVVDDSVTMRTLVSDLLKRLGFTTFEAGNGMEALAVARTMSVVDLVISDVNMPVMDGLSFVQKFRAIPTMRSTPVLMLTTETASEMKERAKSAGATGWLTKPFAPDQLSAVVHRVCP